MRQVLLEFHFEVFFKKKKWIKSWVAMGFTGMQCYCHGVSDVNTVLLRMVAA